jgi:hypothetical protein
LAKPLLPGGTYVSPAHFAAFFIVARAKISVAESCLLLFKVRFPPSGERGGKRLRLARSNMVRGASAGQKPDSRPPPTAGETGRQRAELSPEAGIADEASSPSEGAPHASEARPRGPLPARTRSPGGRKRVRRVYRSVCALVCKGFIPTNGQIAIR